MASCIKTGPMGVAPFLGFMLVLIYHYILRLSGILDPLLRPELICASYIFSLNFVALSALSGEDVLIRFTRFLQSCVSHHLGSGLLSTPALQCHLLSC